MIILPGQAPVSNVPPTLRSAPPPRAGRGTPVMAPTLAHRVISAQLLMDMARISPFQAEDEERRNFRKFQRMNRQTLRLHQVLLPLVSEDETVSVLGVRELVSSESAVLGGGAERGAPVRRYQAVVHQLALPLKAQTHLLPAGDMPPVPVGLHTFKLMLEGSIFPLRVEVLGKDNVLSMFQKMAGTFTPFQKKLRVELVKEGEGVAVALSSRATGEKATYDLKDSPEGFLEKVGLSLDRPRRGNTGGIVHRAQSAVVELDGERFDSPTNEFDLREHNGLTLKAHTLTLRGPVTLEVRRPEGEVVRQVSKLTREMNEHLQFLSREESELLGQVYGRYHQFLGGLAGEGSPLAGLMLQGGRLALDESALRQALRERPDELEALLRGADMGGKALLEEIDDVLATPMALSQNAAVFQPPLKYQPLVVFLTTSSPFLTTALIAQTEGFFLNLFA